MTPLELQETLANDGVIYLIKNNHRASRWLYEQTN